MSEFERFIEANKTSHIVSAGWTVNGKEATKKADHPRNWNYMRVKLKDGQEFLLHRDDVKQIKDFPACWEERK